MADEISPRLETDHKAAVALCLVVSERDVLGVVHVPSAFYALANSNRSAPLSINRARNLSSDNFVLWDSCGRGCGGMNRPRALSVPSTLDGFSHAPHGV